MPSLAGILKRFTDDLILYWERLEKADGFGKPSYNDPISVLVRWEDKEQEIVILDGRKVLSKAYLLTSTHLKPGGWVFLGEVFPSRNEASIRSEWEKTTSFPLPPSNKEGGREILLVNRTPGLKQLPGNVYEIYI